MRQAKDVVELNENLLNLRGNHAVTQVLDRPNGTIQIFMRWKTASLGKISYACADGVGALFKAQRLLRIIDMGSFMPKARRTLDKDSTKP